MTVITNNLPAKIDLAQPVNARGDNSLDQESFLRLLTTQLQSQDPFDPLDNSAMVAQMAQFSTVSGITEMNNSLKAIAGGMTDNRIGDASSWLGHNILVPGNRAAPNSWGQYAGEFHLDTPSQNLSIDFLNDKGEIVQAIELGEQVSGPIAFQWDALDASGKPMPYGQLKVRVNGGEISGLSSWTTVEAVQSPADPANARLMTARGEFSLTDAIRLS